MIYYEVHPQIKIIIPTLLNDTILNSKFKKNKNKNPRISKKEII